MRLTPIESEEQRATIRRQNVGSSESAALFDASPYFTRFMLYHDKAGTAPLPSPENNRINWGELLEPAIAAGVAAEMRWQLRKQTLYAHHDLIAGMGCSVDYETVDHERGPGLVEIKNVDWLIWRQQWTETRAPPHIEFQVQHQLAVTGFSWGAIAVLIGGNELRIYERKPETRAIAAIELAVGTFWASIASGQAPEPFGAPAENDTIKALWPAIEPEKVVDLTGDAEAFELARQVAWAKETMYAPQRIYEASRVKLLAKVGDCGRVIMPGARVKVDRRRAIKVEILPDQPPVFAEPPSPLI